MGRRRALTEQAAEAAVDQACRSLRLPTVRAWVTELADVAGEGAADLPRVPRRAAARRVRRPGTPPLHPTSEGRRVPAGEVLADFDFDANPAINPATIHTLATCAWVRSGDPLCLIGDSGTGKTHLLIGLGTAAAQAACGSTTPWPPSWPTSSSSPLTNGSSPRPSPGTAGSTCTVRGDRGPAHLRRQHHRDRTISYRLARARTRRAAAASLIPRAATRCASSVSPNAPGIRSLTMPFASMK
jgi:hypothetical protein